MKTLYCLLLTVGLNANLSSFGQSKEIDTFFCHNKRDKLLLFNDNDHVLSFRNQRLYKASTVDSFFCYDVDTKTLTIKSQMNKELHLKFLIEKQSLYVNGDILELDSLKAFSPKKGPKYSCVKGTQVTIPIVYSDITVKVHYTDYSPDTIIFLTDRRFLKMILTSKNKKTYFISLTDTSLNKFFTLRFNKFNDPNHIQLFNYSNSIGIIFDGLYTKSKFDWIHYDPNPPSSSISLISTIYEYNIWGKVKKKRSKKINYCD